MSRFGGGGRKRGKPHLSLNIGGSEEQRQILQIERKNPAVLFREREIDANRIR